MSEPTPVSELTFGALRKAQDRRKEFFESRGPDLMVGVTLESDGWPERYDVPTWRRVVVQ